MSQPPYLTIVIPAFNEEHNLPRLFSTFGSVYPTLLLDNYSKDSTVTLGKSFGWSIHQYKNSGYSEDPNLVRLYLSLVETEWIYLCRADEVPCPQLIELFAYLPYLSFDVLSVRRLNLYNNTRCMTWGDDYEFPLFRKTTLNVTDTRYRLGYPGSFHHNSHIVRAPKNIYITHHMSYNVESLVAALNRYSTFTSDYLRQSHSFLPSTNEDPPLLRLLRRLRVILANSRPACLVLLFFGPPLRFVYHFFYKRGFTTPLVGFKTSMLMSFEEAFIWAKLSLYHRSDNGF